MIYSLHGHFGRVIAVDMLGLGFSDKPVSNFKFTLFMVGKLRAYHYGNLI